MGDELVLARLTIDPSRQIAGQNASNASLDSGKVALKNFGAAGNEVTSFGIKLEERLFSLSHVISVLGRAFGIAEIVLFLARSLKQLVMDVITHTEWYKKAAEAVTDWWKSLAEGETAVGSLARKMKEVEGVTGIKSVVEQFQQIQQLEKERQKVVNDVYAYSARSTDFYGGLKKAATMTLQAIDEKLDVTTNQLVKLGFTEAQIGRGLTATFLEPVNEAVEKTAALAVNLAAAEKQLKQPWMGQQIMPDWMQEILGIKPGMAGGVTGRESALGAAAIGFRETMSKLTDPEVTAGLEALMKGFRELSKDEEEARFKLRAFGLEYTASLVPMKFGIEWQDAAEQKIQDLTDSLREFHQEASRKIAITQQWVDLAKSIEVSRTAMQGMQMAVQTLGGALGDAFATGKGHFKEAIGSMLKDLSKMMFVYALTSLALGAAASTPWGFAILGEPRQYFHAAAMFFAAGAAAGLASRALGGGQATGASSSGNSGSSGSRAIGTTGGSSPRLGPQNITVVIQGSVDNADAFARKIAKLLRTAAADGAA